MKKLKHEIFTINETPPDTPFDLGVSYCYPRKISKELLDIPKIAFVNYHPGPLPEYKGPTEYEDAIENKEILIKYPIDFDKKNVWTPNIKIPTTPLNSATYLAPTIPIEVLKKTGKGIPCLWEGAPPRFEKKQTKIDANIEPNRTS